MTRRLPAAIPALWVLSSQAAAQIDTLPRHQGDSLLTARIEAETRAIYDQATSWTFRLTADNLLDLPDSPGTELRGARIQGLVARILAEAWTTAGKYASEYYLASDTLLLVYETFEYSRPTGTPCWRNFKGVEAWQRWSYFQADTVVFARAQGCGAPPPGAGTRELLSRARRLVERLAATP